MRNEVREWLQNRVQSLREGKQTMDQIEIDYYDHFFEVHSDILETLWIQVMEGEFARESDCRERK